MSSIPKANLGSEGIKRGTQRNRVIGSTKQMRFKEEGIGTPSVTTPIPVQGCWGIRKNCQVWNLLSKALNLISENGYYSLDAENPQNHSNQEVQIFTFILRTLMKLPRSLRAYLSEKPPSIWRMSLYRSNVCHSVTTMVELVGMPRPKSGAGHRIRGSNRALNFYYTCFKMLRVMLNLRVWM